MAFIKKYWLLIASLFFVSLSCVSTFLSLRRNEELSQQINILEESVKQYSTENSCLKTNLKLSLYDCSDSCLSRVQVTDVSLSSKPILKYKSDYVLFCRISERYCTTCNRYAIRLAQQLQGVEVIYVIDKPTNRGFINMHDTYNLDYEQMIACEDVGIAVEKELFPYFFAINSQGKLVNIYMPFKNCDSLDLENLQNIVS
ncbi:MAG: hypothetical protein HUJ97_09085 [Bacteroidales bacterium]|nr:hypothetical protein [Bacteroidales bacterium]